MLQDEKRKPLDGIHDDLPKPPRTHFHWMV